MACPYLKRGLLTARCVLTGKTVNLRKYPCLKNYEECPIYKKYIKKDVIEEEHEKLEKKVERKLEEEVKLVEEKDEEEVAGVSCEECLFYSSLTKLCIKLKEKVEDPKRPPCKGKYFRKAK